MDESFAYNHYVVIQAIAQDTRDADLYVSRAQAQIKLENFMDAVDDANKALELNPKLAKAHLRKG